MNGLDAQISIISYAVVSAKYEGKKKLVDSFLPLIEHLLISCSEKTIASVDKGIHNKTTKYGLPTY